MLNQRLSIVRHSMSRRNTYELLGLLRALFLTQPSSVLSVRDVLLAIQEREERNNKNNAWNTVTMTTCNYNDSLFDDPTNSLGSVKRNPSTAQG